MDAVASGTGSTLANTSSSDMRSSVSMVRLQAAPWCGWRGLGGMQGRPGKAGMATSHRHQAQRTDQQLLPYSVAVKAPSQGPPT